MFFRKKEEVPPAGKAGAGAPRYRYDRIEAQMLLLADTCFIIKVYDIKLNLSKRKDALVAYFFLVVLICFYLLYVVLVVAWG